MAHTENWNDSYEQEPADSDSPSGGDDEFRDLKRNVRERMLYEHQWKDSLTTDGHHKEGSARTYYTNTAPTTRPDGSTALDSDDMGRVWFDINDTNALYHWTGTTWCGDVKIASNLEVTGSITFSNTITGPLSIDTITGPLHIASNIDVTGTLTVGGVVDLNSNVNIAGTLTVSGVVDFDSNVQIAGTLTVAGATDLDGTLNVAGTSTLGETTISGTLEVTGTSTFNDDITLARGKRFIGGSTAVGYHYGDMVSENTLYDDMYNQLQGGGWISVSGVIVHDGKILHCFRASQSAGTITIYGYDSESGTTASIDIVNGSAHPISNVALSW